MADHPMHTGPGEQSRPINELGFYTPPAAGTVMATQPPKRIPAPLVDAGGSANCTESPCGATAHDITEANRNG